MRAAGRSATIATSWKNRRGASGWSTGVAKKTSSRASAYGCSSSRDARDDSSEHPKRARARAERRRRPNIRSTANTTCTTSGRGLSLTYVPVPWAYARNSSGIRGSSLRRSAPNPLCQSGTRSGAKRFVRGSSNAACSRAIMASTAVRRSVTRSIVVTTRARQARRLAAAVSSVSIDLWTLRPTGASASAISGRPRVSDQTRCSPATSSSAFHTSFTSLLSASAHAASGEAIAASWRSESLTRRNMADPASVAVATCSPSSRSGSSCSRSLSISLRVVPSPVPS